MFHSRIDIFHFIIATLLWSLGVSGVLSDRYEQRDDCGMGSLRSPTPFRRFMCTIIVLIVVSFQSDWLILSSSRSQTHFVCGRECSFPGPLLRQRGLTSALGFFSQVPRLTTWERTRYTNGCNRDSSATSCRDWFMHCSGMIGLSNLPTAMTQLGGTRGVWRMNTRGFSFGFPPDLVCTRIPSQYVYAIDTLQRWIQRNNNKLACHLLPVGVLPVNSGRAQTYGRSVHSGVQRDIKQFIINCTSDRMSRIFQKRTRDTIQCLSQCFLSKTWF